MSNHGEIGGWWSGWERNWFPTAAAVRWQRSSKRIVWMMGGWFVAFAAAGVIAVLSEQRWAWAVALVLLAIPITHWNFMKRQRRDELAGWQVLSAALHEYRGTGEPRVYGWDSVQEVIEMPDRVVVKTDTGDLVHDGPRPGELAAAIRARIQHQGVEPTTIPPEQVAAWLGIGIDESIRLARPSQKSWASLAVVLAVVASVAISGLGHPVLWLAYGLAALVQLLIWRSGRAVVLVSPYGLEDRRQRLGWDELESVGRFGDSWFVGHGRRFFSLEGPEAERVAGAVEKVLDARDRGAVPGRMGDIPDHAISLANPAEGSTERGISRTAGEER